MEYDLDDPRYLSQGLRVDSSRKALRSIQAFINAGRLPELWSDLVFPQMFTVAAGRLVVLLRCSCYSSMEWPNPASPRSPSPLLSLADRRIASSLGSDPLHEWVTNVRS